MSASRLRTALIVASASIGLTGCVGAYGPMGGVSVGYGNGGYYDPYYGGYGYGGYGRSPYGYGYGYPSNYYGWHNNYYYPGTGYYVYDPYGSRYRWTDEQRRYWEQRRAESIRNKAKIVQTWVDYRRRRNGDSDAGVNRVRQLETVTQPTTVTQPISVTRPRATIREDRRAARQERRMERLEQRRASRREREASTAK